MYLSRLRLNRSRMALLWVANPYRVHQRLLTACEADSHLLFRIEEEQAGAWILTQTLRVADWNRAFGDFPVLAAPPEQKSFDLPLQAGAIYRFRLLANPTVKKTVEKPDGEPGKTRLGILDEAGQLAWLQRKLEAAGAELLEAQDQPQGLIRSRKGPAKPEAGVQTHLGVLFEGRLLAHEPDELRLAVQQGIGPAKGYGFGLLSLARG